MTHGIWASVTGMQVNEYRQALTANNMANLDTVGFKRDFAIVRQRLNEGRENPAARPFASSPFDQLSGGASVRPTHTSFEQGALEDTGRSLDAALVGDGFFMVGDGNEVRYTRDGRFSRNAGGELVLSADGGRFKVLNTAGLPIRIDDPTLGKIEFGGDGSVMQGQETIGKLGIVDFENRAQLRKAGQSTFQMMGNSRRIAATAAVQGGMVEASTVDSIVALTNMIEVSRAYELNARMISLQDETLAMATTRIGRLG
ncbi:MAG: flagellar hook-basal body protein [Planctomycetes bacterium]|nr:flagellar hook-basal body protein [Planctomycetota bacterium]